MRDAARALLYLADLRAARRRQRLSAMLPTRRILLADDDDEVRQGMFDLLEGMGLEVLAVGSGREAVEIARVRELHAALLDFHMPVYTGLECLPLLRSEHAGLPCIVVSGDLTPGMERSAMEAGAFAVLRKPVQPDALRSEVLRALSPWPNA